MDRTQLGNALEKVIADRAEKLASAMLAQNPPEKPVNNIQVDATPIAEAIREVTESFAYPHEELAKAISEGVSKAISKALEESDKRMAKALKAFAEQMVAIAEKKRGKIEIVKDGDTWIAEMK